MKQRGCSGQTTTTYMSGVEHIG